MKLLKNKKILIGIIVLALLLAGWIFWPKGNGKGELVSVARGTVVEEIQTTGQSKPAESVEMSFDRAGRIARVGAKVGDRVGPGQMIASLDSSDLASDLASAEASVLAEKADLAALLRGGRAEEVRLAELKVKNADALLRQNMHSAYNQADDAIRNLTDQMFENPGSAVTALIAVPGNFSDTESINDKRRELVDEFFAWQKLERTLDSSTQPLYDAKQVEGYLTKVRAYLTLLSSTVNSWEPDQNTSAATIAAYRTDLAAARSQVNTAINNLLSAEQVLKTAQDELALKRAPGTAEEIARQEAKVAEAEARAGSLRAQIGKNMIMSPLAGIVTRQDAKVGETAQAGTNVITIMSDGAFEIEAEVAEVDVSKLSIGNPVKITFDAFPKRMWTGQVSYIEPAETIVGGVVNYKIKIAFADGEREMKSGLTANLLIETARHENVLYLPQFAVHETSAGAYVEKVIDGKKVEIPVRTGLRSQDGKTEILSGLSEGEQVFSATQ